MYDEVVARWVRRASRRYASRSPACCSTRASGSGSAIAPKRPSPCMTKCWRVSVTRASALCAKLSPSQGQQSRICKSQVRCHCGTSILKRRVRHSRYRELAWRPLAAAPPNCLDALRAASETIPVPCQIGDSLGDEKRSCGTVVLFALDANPNRRTVRRCRSLAWPMAPTACNEARRLLLLPRRATTERSLLLSMRTGHQDRVAASDVERSRHRRP